MSDDYESMSIHNLRMLLVMRGMDTSHMLHKRELIDAAKKLDDTDYDEEALKIFEQFNLAPSPRERYSNLDALWRHPVSGAGFYVGNIRAASSLQVLNDHGILAVVNCQGRETKNFFEHDSRIKYFRFPVAYLRPSMTRNKEESWALKGYQPAFDFIDASLQSGKNVLVHCLAGAHRAGSLGCAYLMYRAGINLDDAIKKAKFMRPIIGPFGGLLETLHYLERDLERRRNDLAAATSDADKGGNQCTNNDNKGVGDREKEKKNSNHL